MGKYINKKRNKILNDFFNFPQESLNINEERINFTPLLSEIPKVTYKNLLKKIKNNLINIENQNYNDFNEIDSNYDKTTIYDSYSNFNFEKSSFIFEDEKEDISTVKKVKRKKINEDKKLNNF